MPEPSRLLGDLSFELCGWAISERRVKATAVEDLFDEPRQPSGDVLERVVACQVDLLDLQRLHEPLGLGVVVRIGRRAHRAHRPALTQFLAATGAGTPYTSVAFGKRCREMGVRPSMGSVGDAYVNSMAESFFASLECELIDRRSWALRCGCWGGWEAV